MPVITMQTSTYSTVQMASELEVEQARDDDEQHHEQLHRDQRQVDPQRLLDADSCQDRQRYHQQHRQHVDVAVRSDRGRPAEAYLLQEQGRVGGPSLRYDACPQHQLQQQVPADDPGEDLTKGEVGERVRRAGHRHGRGELRITECGQTATDRGKHEGERDTRPGEFLGRAAGQGEDAGADDHADAEDGQV
jgi:hypothetical protein